MRHAEPCAIVTFASTHDALAAEKHLLERGIEGRLIPTPPMIDSECGLAWKSPLAQKDALVSALAGIAHGEVLEMVL